MRNRRRAQSGQTLITFTLAMVLFLFGLFVATVDLVFLYNRYTTVSAAAQIAAQAGANTIDPNSLYSGTVPQLDVFNAPGVCRSAGNTAALATGVTSCSVVDNPQHPGQCPNICAVHAVVTETVTLPLSLFGVSSVVSASADAAPVTGDLSPGP